WEQLYKLYQNGSTFQWSFVLFYLTMFVITPLFGVLLAIKSAGEFRPVIKAIISPVTWIVKLAFKIMGFQNGPVPIQRTMPVYAPVPGGRGGYRGATFKKDASEDDTGTGGSLGGGSGGGHGRPSWQGGPANTQAFPRSEQGRR
ncbi:hypothetical protein EBR96_11215, partial [bacterium]|nr:hypothetical protein [bacterium]